MVAATTPSTKGAEAWSLLVMFLAIGFFISFWLPMDSHELFSTRKGLVREYERDRESRFLFCVLGWLLVLVVVLLTASNYYLGTPLGWHFWASIIIAGIIYLSMGIRHFLRD